MPANSGAIAGTVAHKHSAPSGDGGDLDEGITNFSGGILGEVLTATATDTPVWAPAGGGGGGNYIHDESFTLGGSASTFTCTLATPIAVSGISEIVAVFSGSYADGGGGGLEMQVRTNSETPITDSVYSWGYLNLMDATSTTGVDVDHFLVGASTTDAGSNSSIIMHIIFNATIPRRLNCFWNMAGTNVVATTGGGFTYQSSGDISSFDGIVLTNSAGNNILIDSKVDIYKVTV